MKNDFPESFSKLINEPEFKRLKRSYTEHSIFSFSSLKEEHTTNFISWLLNPREAHKSHIFFESFLDEVKQALQDCKIKHKAALLKKVAKLRRSKKARKSYIFETEKSMNGNDRCDVVGISLSQYLPIYIENKVDSPLSGNQLDRYMQYADETASGEVPLLIFMDANFERNLLEKADPKAVKERWLPISYDWIGAAIEEYLSASAPEGVSFILKSFLTELEMYISTDLNQKNVFWSEALNDLERLGKKYHPLFKNEEYKTLSELDPEEFGDSDFKDQPYLTARFKYSDIFEEIERYNVFNALEWSEELNPGFEYEADIRRKKAYFYPGGLEKVEEYWPVDIRIHQKTVRSEDNSEDEKTVYDLSLSVISKKYESDYATKIRAHFTRSVIAKFSTKKNLELYQLKDHLFLHLKALKAEIDNFNSH